MQDALTHLATLTGGVQAIPRVSLEHKTKDTVLPFIIRLRIIWIFQYAKWT